MFCSYEKDRQKRKRHLSMTTSIMLSAKLITITCDYSQLMGDEKTASALE